MMENQLPVVSDRPTAMIIIGCVLVRSSSGLVLGEVGAESQRNNLPPLLAGTGSQPQGT